MTEIKKHVNASENGKADKSKFSLFLWVLAGVVAAGYVAAITLGVKG
tara:strand:+ start:4355 stop:4495 length:141 start_codon:yes stop_codon:yes gene_type:complete